VAIPDSAARGLFSEIDRLRLVCGEFEAERRRLHARLAQYADENAALRASAFLWIGLYERQVARANGLAEACRLREVRSSERDDVSL
jgi:hypothetical protein